MDILTSQKQMYPQNYGELAKLIKERNAKRIMLHLPDGLKMKAAELCGFLEREGLEVILSGDPCYGACDLSDAGAKLMGCDLLVHAGHNKFYIDFETDVPVLYYIWPESMSISDADFSPIKEKRIGIVASIQHMETLPEAKEMLESQGKEAVIGGQVLGCWTANADRISGDVDAFLFIGSGEFHPLGLKGKPVYRLDVETGKTERVDTEKLEKLRCGRIFQARDARTFGVLVSGKKGQEELQAKAKDIVERLERKGKKAFIIFMNEITDERLLGLKADAFINTACPRIADMRFTKPLLNAEDLGMLLEE